MKQNDQLKQPFFARFLESQMLTEETPGKDFANRWPITTALHDPPIETMKYPSDGDDDIFI